MNKKRRLISLLILILAVLSYAQVGINTKIPLGIFHVDGVANTTAAGANITDDVIVNTAGSLGVGIMPDANAKMNLYDGGTASAPKSVFRLQDGNEGINKMLVSDANGNATWNAYRDYGLTVGKFGAGCNISANSNYTSSSPYVAKRPNNSFTNTTGQITLGKGKWLVKCSMLTIPIGNGIENYQLWLRTTLADSNTVGNQTATMSQRSPDVKDTNGLASNYQWTVGYGGVINGTFTVVNTTGPKVYYLVIGWIDAVATAVVPNTSGVATIFNCGSKDNSQNSLFAYLLE